MGCNNLKILNIKSFDTSDVRNMSDMFNCCTSLTELDLSSFDTLNVTEVIQCLVVIQIYRQSMLAQIGI